MKGLLLLLLLMSLMSSEFEDFVFNLKCAMGWDGGVGIGFLA